MSRLWVHAAGFDPDSNLTLSAEESRHVAARRARVGDALVVFDGAGRVGQASIESLGRRGVVARVESVETIEAAQDRWVLATAIPKGERLATLLPMLTQLGVPCWQPLVLGDSAVRTLDVESARLRRILVEGAKLARRPWLLEVPPPIDFETLLACDALAAGRCVLGDQGGEGLGVPGDALLVVIGPEAGFTALEGERLRGAGARACRLAPHNLRIETAAIAAAATRFAAHSDPPGDQAFSTTR